MKLTGTALLAWLIAAAPAFAAPCYLSQSGPIEPGCGAPVVYNGSAPATLALPGIAWTGTIIDQGPGAVTLSGGAAPVNGSTAGVTLAAGAGGTVAGDPSLGWTFAGQTAVAVVGQSGSAIAYGATLNPAGTSQVLTNASGTTAVSLPAASGFGASFSFQLYAENAPATLTPASGTINGAASLAVGQGQWAFVQGDGTNYEAAVSGNSCDAGFAYDAESGQCAWTQTANNSAALAWTGLVRNDYRIFCSNLLPAAAENIYLQFGEGATPTWKTASYEWFSVYAGSSAGPAKSSSTSDVGIALPGTVGSSGIGDSGYAMVQGLQGVANNKSAEGLFMLYSGSSAYRQDVSGYYGGDLNPVTALRVIAASSTNLASGSCTLQPFVVGQGQ